MNDNRFKSTMLTLGATILILAAVGCGGGGSTGATAAIGFAPAVGNYEAAFQAGGSAKAAGSVLIDVDNNANVIIGVGVSNVKGNFTGSSTISINNTFSVALNNSTNGQVVMATGSTSSGSLKVSLSGAVVATNVIATYKGTTNPLTGNFSGTISGGLVGTSQPLSFTVGSTESGNVSGTISTTSNGTLNLSGDLSSIGTFTADAQLSPFGDTIVLQGSFSIGANGKAQGSGTWIDLSGANSGTWTASAN